MNSPREIIEAVLLETKKRNYSLEVAKRFIRIYLKGNIQTSVLEKRLSKIQARAKRMSVASVEFA